MRPQTLKLSLCTIAAVGIVYYFTDSLLLTAFVLVVGLLVVRYFDRRLALAEAQDYVTEADIKSLNRIRASLDTFKTYKDRIAKDFPGVLGDAVNNIYDVSHHILYEKEPDLKFVHQVGIYLPRLNKIMDTFLAKSADGVFKTQAKDFLIETSSVFSRLLIASGNQDVKEAESLMQALEDTYKSHGHLKRNEGGNQL